MIALVGESGSGKTTIANLLARFWDVQEGEVKLRGVNVKELPMETLMTQISMVFQKVYLFEDTIYNNIAMGRPEASYIDEQGRHLPPYGGAAAADEKLERGGERMSKNTCRMIGLLTMLVSVFLLIGGLYLGPAGVPALVPRLCLIAGLVLLVVGVVFYRILKSE